MPRPPAQPNASSWRTGGIGPERTGAGLRGIGLIVIVIAFLAGSNSFLSGGRDDEPKATGAAEKPTVAAPEALREILPTIEPMATYVFATEAELKQQVERKDALDLLITGAPGDARSLATRNLCSDAIGVAQKGTSRFVACIPTSAQSGSANGLRYLETLTGLKARAALLDAGFELPDR